MAFQYAVSAIKGRSRNVLLRPDLDYAISDGVKDLRSVNGRLRRPWRQRNSAAKYQESGAMAECYLPTIMHEASFFVKIWHEKLDFKPTSWFCTL